MTLFVIASLGPGIDVWGLVAMFLCCLGALVLALARWVRAQPAGPRSGVSIDEWHRRGLGVQPSEGIVEFQPGQRCPLCRVEHRPTSEAARCDACGTLSHLQCSLEVGRCSTLACPGSARRVDAVEQRHPR